MVKLTLKILNSDKKYFNSKDKIKDKFHPSKKIYSNKFRIIKKLR